MALTNNPIIITGHYGSGKTEFAVNYASYLGKRGEAPILADMDIVNAYFRARLMRERLREDGVKVVSSNLEEEYYNDTPALSAFLYSCFEDPGKRSVIDLGGDPVGAVVIARFAYLLENRDYAMWMTVNANRLHTQTADEVLEYLSEIENVSHLKINGFLNTTHMLRETEKEDILKGDALVRLLTEQTGIPTIYTIVPRFLEEEMLGEDLAAEVFPVDLMMCTDYM